MDVIKTRLQTQGIGTAVEHSDVVHNVKYHDVLSTMRTIHKEEGLSGFSKGMLPRAMLSSVSSALSWVAYEFIKSMWLSV